MEWMNCNLQQYLNIFTAEKQDEWVDWIALAQFSYNTKKQSSTQKSPFEVICTNFLQMGIEKRSTKAPATDSLMEGISNTLESVRQNLKQAQDKMKSQADKHCSNTPIYQPEDQVWLSMDNLCLPWKSKKLSEKWIGPYLVVKMVGTNAVELHLPHSMQIHPVINISCLKSYKEYLLGQLTICPGPMEVTEDKEEEYEVEWIIDSCWKGQCLEYLIHWKGYLEEEHTWEFTSNLTYTMEAIAEFHQSIPQVPWKLWMAYLDFLFLFHKQEDMTETDSCNILFNHLDTEVSI